ncbi:hypothetical protein [Bradyrhizobium ivorense]|nr:hypothetical protein [Bradyrhizobium ivorense]
MRRRTRPVRGEELDNSDKQSPADKVIARYRETYRLWLLNNKV